MTDPDGVEQVDELVAEELLPLEHGVGDLLDPVAVQHDEVVCDDVCLTEHLGGDLALGGVGEDPGDRVAAHHPAARAVHDLEADSLEPLEDALARLVLRLVRPSGSTANGWVPIAEEPTIQAAWLVTDITSPPTPLEFSS